MDKSGPKPVEGGIDHGKDWETLTFGPDATPEAAALALLGSYTSSWLRELHHRLLPPEHGFVDPVTCEHGAPDFLNRGHLWCSQCGSIREDEASPGWIYPGLSRMGSLHPRRDALLVRARENLLACQQALEGVGAALGHSKLTGQRATELQNVIVELEHAIGDRFGDSEYDGADLDSTDIPPDELAASAVGPKPILPPFDQRHWDAAIEGLHRLADQADTAVVIATLLAEAEDRAERRLEDSHTRGPEYAFGYNPTGKPPLSRAPASETPRRHETMPDPNGDLKQTTQTAHEAKYGEAGAFKKYRKRQLQEMRPYIEGETLPGSVSISESDRKNGSPKSGDMIARNPQNHEDQWLVAEPFFLDNYEDASVDEP